MSFSRYCATINELSKCNVKIVQTPAKMQEFACYKKEVFKTLTYVMNYASIIMTGVPTSTFENISSIS